MPPAVRSMRPTSNRQQHRIRKTIRRRKNDTLCNKRLLKAALVDFEEEFYIPIKCRQIKSRDLAGVYRRSHGGSFLLCLVTKANFPPARWCPSFNEAADICLWPMAFLEGSTIPHANWEHVAAIVTFTEVLICDWFEMRTSCALSHIFTHWKEFKRFCVFFPRRDIVDRTRQSCFL